MSTPLEMFGEIAGGFQKGNAAKANAKLAEQNAATVMEQAGLDEGEARRERSRLVGAQIAATGASGVALDGTPMSTIIDDAVRSESEALAIRYRGKLQATGYKNEARQLRLAGSQAIAGGYIGAWSALERGVARAITAGVGAGAGATGGALNSALLSKTPDGKPAGYYVVK